MANGLCLLDTKLTQAASDLLVSRNNRTFCMAQGGDESFIFQSSHLSMVGYGPTAAMTGLEELGFNLWD